MHGNKENTDGLDDLPTKPSNSDSPFKTSIQKYLYQETKSPTTAKTTSQKPVRQLPPRSTRKRKAPDSPTAETKSKSPPLALASKPLRTRPSSSTPTPKSKPKPHSKRPRQLPSSLSSSPSIPSHLTDTLLPSLLILFIGLNPGLTTASTGHAYAHPSNLFWKLLYSSAITHPTPNNKPLPPSATASLPQRYGIGNTNLVSRPTRNGAELSREEMWQGVGVLEEKVRRWRPEVVGVVGKGVWGSVEEVRRGREGRRGGGKGKGKGKGGLGEGEGFRYGWQPVERNMGRRRAVDAGKEEGEGEGEWQGARVYVLTTTSGLAAGMTRGEKEAIWKGLGDWVVGRRGEREREREERKKREGGREGVVDDGKGEGEEEGDRVGGDGDGDGKGIDE